jgi:hypothetical protein
MPRIARVLVWLVIGYLAGAVLGWAGITLSSTNTHDKSLEAAMTAAFVAGPAGAVAGALFALFRR